MCAGECVRGRARELCRSPYPQPFGNLLYEIFISVFSNVHVLRNSKQHRQNIQPLRRSRGFGREVNNATLNIAGWFTTLGEEVWGRRGKEQMGTVSI